MNNDCLDERPKRTAIRIERSDTLEHVEQQILPNIVSFMGG